MVLPERVFRAFGSVPSDINLDFMTSAKIQVSLDLLSRCSKDPKVLTLLLQSSGSERILALWNLVWSSGPQERVVDIPLQCQEPGCKEAMALTLTEEELCEVVKSASVSSEGLPVPSSQDMLDLLQQPPQEWIEKFIEGTQSLDQAGELLQQRDPLVALNCATQCPACGRQQNFSLDLEGMALRYLQGIQRELLKTVHQLAERYHWSEDQILALPVWRRNHYLQLLQRESRWS